MAGLRGIMNRFLGGRGATTRGTGVGATTGGTDRHARHWRTADARTRPSDEESVAC